MNGSNNWAVGGALTENGRALVSNDMHLGHDVPNIWYQARLVAGPGRTREHHRRHSYRGRRSSVAGSNGNIAWGYTNSYGDWSDAVVLRPGAAPGTYRTPARATGLRVVRIARQIEVKDGEPGRLRDSGDDLGPRR